jgi:hypothetical protein
MILISAKTKKHAEGIANGLGVGPQAYIYLPLEGQERVERLRRLSGIKLQNLHGHFSYEEQERVCRIIG